MKRHSKTPKGAWAEVTLIEDRVGPHGGRFWLLHLACGHLKSARKPKLHDFQVVSRRRIAFAPKRVRCLLCKETS